MIDEQEYQRLMKLDWHNKTYEPLGISLMCSVAWDNDDLVFMWYSAQPAPDFGVLPNDISIIRREMFLEPHYMCFAWINGIAAHDSLPLIQARS